jgi:hypothetical protein
MIFVVIISIIIIYYFLVVYYILERERFCQPSKSSLSLFFLLIHNTFNGDVGRNLLDAGILWEIECGIFPPWLFYVISIHGAADFHPLNGIYLYRAAARFFFYFSLVLSS